MLNIHQRYCTETFDAAGNLASSRIHVPEDFNYAFDVIDEIGRVEPERMAMIWRNPEGEAHDLRFSDLAHWSDKVACFMASQGIGKGDMVMVILRRHYSFWITALGLHKIGAVVIPATFMLKEHDVEYRIKAAGVKAIITTTVGTITDIIDAACENLDEPPLRFLMNGAQYDIPSSTGTTYDPAMTGPALSGPDGLFGATYAHQAKKQGKKCLVIDIQLEDPLCLHSELRIDRRKIFLHLEGDTIAA